MVAERMKISPYMVWFIVHPIQFGMSELWFDRLLVKDAGYDGWAAIIIAGTSTGLLIWIIYSVMKKGKGSVIDIHRQLFGKVMGGGLSFLLILLFLLEGVSILCSYEEIVQVWLFPEMGKWLIGILALSLVYYAVNGGFRVVVGVCFFGFLIPLIVLTPVLIFPLKFAHVSNMLPILNHPLFDYFKAAKDITMGFAGFEGLLISYPFIKNAASSQKWAHFGNLFTLGFYLLITLITFSYFSEGELEKLYWPKLDLVKVTELPFIQGFDYFFISLWLLVILPNLCYAIWAASRASKELLGVKQRKMLIVIVAVVFVVPMFFRDHTTIEELNRLITLYAFYFLSLYLPVLWAIQRVRGYFGEKKCSVRT